MAQEEEKSKEELDKENRIEKDDPFASVLEKLEYWNGGLSNDCREKLQNEQPIGEDVIEWDRVTWKDMKLKDSKYNRFAKFHGLGGAHQDLNQLKEQLKNELKQELMTDDFFLYKKNGRTKNGRN